MFLNGCSVLWIHWGGRPTFSVVGPPSEAIEISVFQNPENGPGPWAYVLWVYTGGSNLASLCSVTLPSKSFFLHYMPYLSLWIQADNVFCWYKFLKVLVGLPFNSCESKLSGEKRRGCVCSIDILWINASLFLASLDGWLDPWVTHLISLTNSCPATHLALCPEHPIWIGWESSKSLSADSPLLQNAFAILSVF